MFVRKIKQFTPIPLINIPLTTPPQADGTLVAPTCRAKASERRRKSDEGGWNFFPSLPSFPSFGLFTIRA
jgi:hypothetical protein